VRFAVETAVAFDGGANPDCCAFELKGANLPLADVAEHKGVTGYAVSTNIRHLRVQTALSKPATLWRFPLETVTNSEAGFERRYQGTAFLQLWPLHLEPGEAWQVELTLDASVLG
jgi:hypothetical protein